jgi:alkanesulfonate monooxygenase SsuD/methylene tetrahydromethanopterin reductase-like flavin-dependent oxidoreductase (luciferase family)
MNLAAASRSTIGPRFWRMGATPVPATEIGPVARTLEQIGWDGLALGEAHGLLPDPYVLLGVAAGATSTLLLGTSVAVPLRHPLLAAGAMATVHAIACGRTRFVVGRGDGAMKVLQREPMPVAQFEEYLRALVGYLRRDEVESGGAVSSMSRLDDIDPSLALAPPEVSVSATGPRAIAAAARWADGIDFSVGADVARLRRCMSQAREACESAGRDPAGLSLGCYLQVAITGDGYDAAEAVRGLIITHSRFSGNFSSSAAEAMEKVLTATRGGVARTGRPGELAFYPKEALAGEDLSAFGIIGPCEECVERLSEIASLGFTNIYIGTRAVGVDLEEQNALRIGGELLPRVRELTSCRTDPSVD